MEDDLEQQVAELLAQVGMVAAVDGVGDLIRLFDRVGRDAGEILGQIPVAAALRIAQGAHDRDEARQRGQGVGQGVGEGMRRGVVHPPGLDKRRAPGNSGGMTRRTLLASLSALALAAGCSRLDTLNGLNAVTPGDGGVVRRVDGAAYGSDPRQKLDVYAPDGAATPRPVIVFFYGGGWNSGYRGGYAFVARALAARGFVVVVPDYRLVPQVRFPAFVEDAAAAVRWTVAHVGDYGGDPARIAVAGHSAGAHIALLLTLDRGYLARAGAAGAIKAAVGLAGTLRLPAVRCPVGDRRLRPGARSRGDAADPLRPRRRAAGAAAHRRCRRCRQAAQYRRAGRGTARPRRTGRSGELRGPRPHRHPAGVVEAVPREGRRAGDDDALPPRQARLRQAF